MKIFKSNWILWAGLAVLAAAGIGLMLYVTPMGVGLVNDSVGYIGGARNILAGNGYSRLTGNSRLVPITNYPPLFSIVLAGVGLLGIDGIDAAKYLNVFLFGANAMLFGWLIFKILGSKGLALVGAGFFVISNPFIITHAYAMSEPLYLFLGFVVFLFYGCYLSTQRKWFLILCGVFSSLALLTRYIGISLYMVILLGLVIYHSRWKTRIVDGGIYLFSGTPLVTIWLIRNMMVTQNAGNRLFVYHPITIDKIQEGLINFWGWVLPENYRIAERLLPLWGVITALFLLAVGLGCIWILRNRIGKNEARFNLGWVMAAFLVVYLGILVMTLTFLDASPIFEHRILAPFYISFLFIVLVILAWMWTRGKRWLRVLTVFVCLGMMLSFIQESKDTILQFHKDGQGMAGAVWTESLTIKEAKTLPKTQIYSNKSTALYLLVNRPAYILPSPTNPATGQPTQNYSSDVQKIRATVLEGRGIIIFFDYKNVLESADGRTWFENLTNGLPILKQFEDGILFGVLQ